MSYVLVHIMYEYSYNYIQQNSEEANSWIVYKIYLHNLAVLVDKRDVD